MTDRPFVLRMTWTPRIESVDARAQRWRTMANRCPSGDTSYIVLIPP
jgi:hypothetical protein